MKTKTRYSIEFFHIYTDETIGAAHKASINYLKAARVAWDFDYDLIVMIDNYNPVDHILDENDVMRFLDKHDVSPDYYAFEASMVENAKLLLETVKTKKLRKSYNNYIEQHHKYPCSLLTASWYLTRLGALPNSSDIITSTNGSSFEPVDRLINILPIEYKPVEQRAIKIIDNSDWHHMSDKVQDLFYPVSANRKIDLF